MATKILYHSCEQPILVKRAINYYTYAKPEYPNKDILHCPSCSKPLYRIDLVTLGELEIKPRRKSMKIGDIVKVKGTDRGYKDTYTVTEYFTNIKNNGEDIALICWQEPHTHNVKTQFVPTELLEVVPKDENK